MSTQPTRSHLAIAIAIVIAGVLISASLFVAVGEAPKASTSTSTSTTTTTVTTTQTAIYVEGTHNSNSTTDSLAITLTVGDTTELAVGHNETILVSLTNDLLTQRNVNYTEFPTFPHGPDLSSAASFDYILPLQPPCGYPSTSNYEPAFIVIYNATGSAVQLSDSPQAVINCISGPGQTYHPFNASQTITEAINIGGHWTSSDSNEPWINATYSQFAPGNYTIVAFDPWNQLTTLNFTVSNVSSNGLAFIMDLNSSSIVKGGAVQVEMNLYNTLSGFNNVTVSNDWQLTNQSELSNSTSFGPGACSGSMGPYRVAVFSGFYGLNNYSSAAPLSIFPWPASSPYNYCGTYVIEHSWLGSSYYLFQPQSNNAKLHLVDQGSWDTPMSLTVVLKPLNVTFPPGEYTVVGGDEWGSLQVAHFIVEQS